MFLKILKNKKNLRLFIFLNVLIWVFYFIFKNFGEAKYIFNVSLFSFGEKLNIFFKNLFDLSELSDPLMFLLVFLFVLSLSLFFLLSYLLFKESKKISKKGSVWNTFWIFISVVGMSCASCGIGLLASLLSFLGLSSLVTYFPLHGLEIGFLGVLALNISNYFLWKRLKNPFTC